VSDDTLIIIAIRKSLVNCSTYGIYYTNGKNLLHTVIRPDAV
jgi:hypothetical protein